MTTTMISDSDFPCVNNPTPTRSQRGYTSSVVTLRDQGYHLIQLHATFDHGKATEYILRIMVNLTVYSSVTSCSNHDNQIIGCNIFAENGYSCLLVPSSPSNPTLPCHYAAFRRYTRLALADDIASFYLPIDFVSTHNQNQLRHIYVNLRIII